MKRIIALLLLMFVVTAVPAQLSENLNRHFIIAVDASLPRIYKVKLSSDQASKRVNTMLNNYFHISDSDYVSMVSYGINIYHPDFNRFAVVLSDYNGKAISWRRLQTDNETNFRISHENKISGKDRSMIYLCPQLGSWGSLVTQRASELRGIKASFQSGAKPYILSAVKSRNGESANETYIIMLTDEAMNAVDLGSEYHQMATSTNDRSVLHEFTRCKEQVMSLINGVNSKFRFEQVALDNNGNKEYVFPGGQLASGGFKLVVYKVIPTDGMPVQVIANIPPRLPFKRVRGGYSFDMYNQNSNDYKIQKISLSIAGKYNSSVYNSTWNTAIKDIRIGEGDTAAVRFWVKYNDGYYNGVTKNPYDSEYSKTMTIKQPVNIGDEAKIFGVIPVFDIFWWFWPGDIDNIVIFWDLILVLVFIIVILVIFKKIIIIKTTYSTDKNDITLNHN